MKTRYESRYLARLALTDILHDVRTALAYFARTGHIPRRVYECRECGAWHLTSQGR